MSKPAGSEWGAAGTSLASLVFLVFLVLKLINKVSWSWWWVTAPLWGPLAALLALAGLFLLMAGLASLIERLIERRR